MRSGASVFQRKIFMKKVVTMIFLLLLLTFIGVFCASAGDNRKPARIIYGDVNLDGAVNISDAAQIQKYLALYKTDSVLNLINDKNLTDFNGDGIISISDVTALKKHIAGIDSGSMIGATAYILSDSEYLRAVEVSSPDEPVMNHLYVSKSYDKDEACFGEFKFNTILDANESISSNSEKNRYTIHVADGTYTDLQERFSGVDDSQRAAAEYCGVTCKDYVYYEGNADDPEKCVIEWDGNTGFNKSIVYKTISKKAPFHIAKIQNNSLHTYIRGFNFRCKNLRYCIHIETGGKGANVEWKIINCVFDWGGDPDCTDLAGKGSKAAIGAGHSPFEHGEFINCTVNSETEFSYLAHDNKNYSPATSDEVSGAEIVFDNCDLGGGNILCMSLKGDGIVASPYMLIFKNCENAGIVKHSVSSPSTKSVWQVLQEQ